MDTLAVVKVVPTEHEAEIACSLLRTAGIKCAYREPNISAQSFWGWREIVVGDSDLESARSLLATTPPGT